MRARMHVLLGLGWFGCTGDPVGGTAVDADPPEPPSVTPPPSVPGGCASDPAQAVTVTAAQGLAETTLALSVAVSVASPVVARCTADGDPLEVQFAEATAAATSHTLELAGLLADTAYTCDVAATCPASGAVAVAHHTGARPAVLAATDLALDVDPAFGAPDAYTLTNWHPWECVAGIPDPPGYLMAWDPRGVLRWWSPLDPAFKLATEVTLHPTEPLVGWGGGDTEIGWPRLASPTTGPAYEASAIPALPDAVYSHDFRILPDGRMLTLEYVPNSHGVKTWIGFEIRLWDPVTSAVTFSLNSQELVDSRVIDVPASSMEPYHANALVWSETATGPRLTISLCRDESILLFDVDTRVATRLARGEGWTVEDADGTPLTDADLPQCTHGIDVYDDGTRMVVYDNGRERLQSSASEWILDVDARTATRSFMWTEPGWYEFILGDVDDLGDGRLLVTQARKTCDEPATSVEVVRETGEVAVRTTFPDGSVYRSERIDGCRLFGSARDCPATAARLAEVAPLLDGVTARRSQR